MPQNLAENHSPPLQAPLRGTGEVWKEKELSRVNQEAKRLLKVKWKSRDKSGRRTRKEFRVNLGYTVSGTLKKVSIGGGASW